jgi:S1-C subfamily serine protease
MQLERRLESFRNRADRALGDHRVDQALAKFRAIIGPQNVPDSEPLAQQALDKLHRGEAPTAEEITGLEIVVRLLRPVVFCHDGVLDDLPDRADQNLQPKELKDLWGAFRDRVRQLVGSIGRIEDKSGKHIGTGFLVASDALATNRHVLGALTFGSEVLAPGTARVVFRQEQDRHNQPTDIVPIEGTLAIHPKLDIVLLKLTQQDRAVLELEEAVMREGDKVAAIGFPGNDPVNNPLFLSGVFKGKFGVKRAALGEVLDAAEPPRLFHDCSTTQGNSGSPVFSLNSGRVAGIHCGGFFMYRNEAVDSSSLRQFVADRRL